LCLDQVNLLYKYPLKLLPFLQSHKTLSRRMSCPHDPGVILTSPYLRVCGNVKVGFEYPGPDEFEVVFEEGNTIIAMLPDEMRRLFELCESPRPFRMSPLSISLTHEVTFYAGDQPDSILCKISSVHEGTSVVITLPFLCLLKEEMSKVLDGSCPPYALDHFQYEPPEHCDCLGY